MEALDELTLRRRRQRMLNPITGELARLEQLMFVHTPPSTPSASASSHMEEPKAEERPEAQAEEEELIPQPPVEPRPQLTSPLPRLRSKSRMEQRERFQGTSRARSDHHPSRHGNE
jgi:hypothetical protein